MNVGEKINHFEFLRFTESKIRLNGSKRKMAEFKCDCGTIKVYDYFAVKTGHTKQCKSCGIICSAKSRAKHSKIHTPLYRKWQDMKKRCYNKNVKRYKNYGALGVIVCDSRRNNFINFYDWCISNGYSENLELDRIDVLGNYEPNNCRWATRQEQTSNTRRNVYVWYNDRKITLSQLYRDANIPISKTHTVRRRIIEYGWSVEEAIKV